MRGSVREAALLSPMLRRRLTPAAMAVTHACSVLAAALVAFLGLRLRPAASLVEAGPVSVPAPAEL